MNRRQRVIDAIACAPGRPVARGELVIDRGFARDFINWKVQEAVADVLTDTSLLLACCRFLKLDLVCVPADGQAGLLSPPAVDMAKFADEGLFVFWLTDGVFQTSMTERGMMATMTAMAQSPDAVGRELQQHSRQVLAAMDRGAGAGAHGIIIGDDIAYQQGTYMSPQFLEEYLLPVWTSQVAFAHDLGVPVFFHSDGNLNAVLPHVVAAGFDGLQCLEPAAGMDIGGIKSVYGQSLCLMGNIDPALLCGEPGGPAQTDDGEALLEEAVDAVLAAAGGQGGFIFGTCSGLHAGMRPERVQRLYQLARARDPVDRASAD